LAEAASGAKIVLEDPNPVLIGTTEADKFQPRDPGPEHGFPADRPPAAPRIEPYRPSWVELVAC
jgi:hypothetical protein